MQLQIEAKAFQLQFKKSFGIAHGTRTHTDSLFVRARFGNVTGYGEAALPPYLGYDVHNLVSQCEQHFPGAQEGPAAIAEVLMKLAIKDNTIPAPLRAAVDMALLDVWGKLTDKPVRSLLQIDDPGTTRCSYTLGISSVAEMLEKINEAGDFRLFKIKLGGDNDRERISAYKAHTSYPFCVDANQCWKSVDVALREMNWLKEQGCLFVEQPLPIALQAQYGDLFQKRPLPIILDESIQQIDDLERLADVCDGINVKLVKCGGITPGIELIRRSRHLRKSVLIGCMSEGSCGAAGAAQLAGLADWVDLDGPMLISNDPFSGVEYKEGSIVVNELPGLGISLQNESLF